LFFFYNYYIYIYLFITFFINSFHSFYILYYF
jgi:hypothetical protein